MAKEFHSQARRVNSMSDKFDAYDYIGVIAPGSVTILAAAVIYPELKLINIGTEASVGGLGFFLIISFVVGHLLQSLGSLIGKALWLPFGGLPSQWVLKDNQSLLSKDQAAALFTKVTALRPNFVRTAEDASSEWVPITREIFALVQAASRSDRIDTFNRSYGLMRGMASGFAIATMLVIIRYPTDLTAILVVFASVCVSIYRTYHFGVLYARELFVTYVTLA